MRHAMNTFSKIFYIRRTKLLRNGEAPIYLRITVNGIRTDLAIFRSIQPNLWDSAKGRVKGNSRDIRELNAYLDEYMSRLIECKRQLENDYRPVTAESLKNRLLGNDEINFGFLQVFKDHNDKLEKLGEREVALGTIEGIQLPINTWKISFHGNTKKAMCFYGMSTIALSRISNSI
jgi:hypothetical protein